MMAFTRRRHLLSSLLYFNRTRFSFFSTSYKSSTRPFKARTDKNSSFISDTNRPFKPRTDRTSFEPRDNRRSFEPRNNGRSFEPRTDRKSFEPRTDRKSFEPRNNRASFESRNNGKSFEPRNNGKSFEPRNNGKSFEPRTDRKSFEPINSHRPIKAPSDKKFINSTRPFKARTDRKSSLIDDDNNSEINPFKEPPDTNSSSFDTINYQIEGIPTAGSIGDVPSFKELGLKSHLTSALAREGITEPTPIQARSLAHTLTYHHLPCIIQSETGTGKTLVYLLPALQDTRPGLTTIIVTPSRELAIQVYITAKKLTGKRKDSRRVGVIFSGNNENELLENIRSTRPHILIGTPKIIEQFTSVEPETQFAGLKRLILDEGDNLLKSLTDYATWATRRNRDRHPKPTKLLTQRLLKLRNNNLELVCASATIPKPFQEELREMGWGDEPTIISTFSNRYSVPKCIQHEYKACPPGRKINKMVEHFRDAGRKQALVFIHRNASIDEFIKQLTSLGIRARPLYKEFLDIENYDKFLSDFKEGHIEMVVGTEATVRGLDFSFVEMLYLTEVPRNTNEYLHLAGRVGRMGREGIVVTFIEEENEEKKRERREREARGRGEGKREGKREGDRGGERKKEVKSEGEGEGAEGEGEGEEGEDKKEDGEGEGKKGEGSDNKLISRLLRMFNILGVSSDTNQKK